jgi:cell pole-organizing protein PopZ
MAKLLASNVAVERDEPVRVGRVTLEDIARDLMRPLIKTWLDQNLPRVIEKVVAKEMEKLARRARDED